MVVLIKLMDRLFGKFFCNLLGIFKSKKTMPKNPKSILIIQLWGLGETVLTLPAIQSIRRKFPDAKIDILATKRNSKVYNEIANIRVIEIKTDPLSISLFFLRNRDKYEIVVDMEEYLNISAIIAFFAGKWSIGYSHGARSRVYDTQVEYNDNQHACVTFLDLATKLGAKEVLEMPSLNYDNKDKKFVNEYLKKIEIKKDEKIICIAPGAAESAKSRIWPINNYSRLCEILAKNFKCKIILIGVENENELINNVLVGVVDEKLRKSIFNSAGVFNLNQLFCLLDSCDLFIGNDSGPMHVAAAQKTKTIGIFGPNTPVRFGPYGNGNSAIYKKHSCDLSPCINVHKGEVPDCLYAKNSPDYQKCMKSISVEEVFKEVEKLIYKK